MINILRDNFDRIINNGDLILIAFNNGDYSTDLKIGVCNNERVITTDGNYTMDSDTYLIENPTPKEQALKEYLNKLIEIDNS